LIVMNVIRIIKVAENSRNDCMETTVLYVSYSDTWNSQERSRVAMNDENTSNRDLCCVRDGC